MSIKPSNKIRVVFHLDQLCLRGTTTATREMAYWFQQLVPNSETFIVYKTDGPWPNEPIVKKELESQGINLRSYRSSVEGSLEKLVKKINPWMFYRLYHGTQMSRWPESGARREFNHAIFMHPDSRTDAYISSWMSNEMMEMFTIKRPFLNHIVNLPDPEATARVDIRKICQIPDDAFVFGRIGGFETFDIPFVREAINTLVQKRDDVYFLFVNTDPAGLIDSDKILFLDKMVNTQEKANYISACDAMIHARTRGETFGIACAEFLGQQKPVLTCHGSPEKAHIVGVLDQSKHYEKMTYGYDVLDKMEQMVDNPFLVDDLDEVLAEFKPIPVIRKFVELTGL